jgi:putative serine protease PepD
MLALALGIGAAGGALGTAALNDPPTPARVASAPNATSAPASAPTAAATASPLPDPRAIQNAPAGANSVAGQVYERAGGAVVEVIARAQTRRGPGGFGGGSGFVVDARGLILTNDHVVDGARSVSVRFADGEERDARVLGTDRGNDLALLRVDLPRNTPVAALGNSDEVSVGETAIAIGSPFGLEQTVTQGIISAVDRDWAGGGRTQRNLIQTDTPINPGNSGGPLLNARGEVIGMNTFNEGPVRGSVGVGFAVPINTAKQLLPRLEAGAKLQPAWLGISGTDLNAQLAREQGLKITEGVLVLQVLRGGPAYDAGLRGAPNADPEDEEIPPGGDIITAIDGAPVKDMSGVVDRIAAKQPGDKVQLTILRDGRERQITVELEEWPDRSRSMPVIPPDEPETP